MEMPFMGQESIDDFFSGQAAALAGGTTMHIDFALPVDGDLAAGYQAWVKKAAKSCMDYGFHMAVTKWNADVAKDMEWLVNEKGTHRILECSFHVFMLQMSQIWLLQEFLELTVDIIIFAANLDSHLKWTPDTVWE